MKQEAFSFNCSVCNKVVYTQPTQIKYRNRKTCSLKCRAVVRRSEAEERRKTYTKHQLDRLARYSPEAKEWRVAIFERDNYTCGSCGERGGYLEADHIKPWAYFPDLRFELSNGRTLCRSCHGLTKMSAKRMREIYGQER
jgi:5-methylcytosine-specific restriction endonuclease McrA